ncbi:MAG: BON domain-containing protein [Ignavibacteriales bacterium]|nr:BON domain-containing protein [Ignavibacteriales bacterium]
MKTMCRGALALLVAALLLIAVPLHAYQNDDRIVSSARNSYAFQVYLKGDDIKIESKNGAVTLTGVVSEEFHKILANETLAALPGVISVDNRLELKGAPPTANSDAWLETKVKATLLFHRNVSASNTEIDVKDGIATLRGNATSQAQKELTTEYAKDVDGIKSVNNEMTVSGRVEKTHRTVAVKIDDASITAQVKMALWTHRSTSVVNTKVETNRGVVTLSGKAKNAAERDLVTKLVGDIDGVKSIKNLMIIE